jgi:cell division protein FtsI (penicillin-binding protein 3)
VLSAATLGTATHRVKPPSAGHRRLSADRGSAGAISGPPQLKKERVDTSRSNAGPGGESSHSPRVDHDTPRPRADGGGLARPPAVRRRHPLGLVGLPHRLSDPALDPLRRVGGHRGGARRPGAGSARPHRPQPARLARDARPAGGRRDGAGRLPALRGPRPADPRHHHRSGRSPALRGGAAPAERGAELRRVRRRRPRRPAARGLSRSRSGALRETAAAGLRARGRDRARARLAGRGRGAGGRPPRGDGPHPLVRLPGRRGGPGRRRRRGYSGRRALGLPRGPQRSRHQRAPDPPLPRDAADRDGPRRRPPPGRPARPPTTLVRARRRPGRRSPSAG